MRFVLLGDPVAQSKSPAMHNAAFRALGLAHTYEAIRVREDELGSWVHSLRRGVARGERDVGGLNVTVPYKVTVMQLADEIDASAKAAGACNVLAMRDGRLVAYNTDVPAIEAELGDGGAGTAIVLGRGGAARAAIVALKNVGAAKIIVRARAGGDETLESTGTERGARWIVQATSAGMTGADPGDAVAHAVRFELAPQALALDVVYEPRETPFLAAARSAGLRCKNGLGILARQGALAFELWLGVPAPSDVMRRAIE
jgi:shikimate dehydrogenase